MKNDKYLAAFCCNLRCLRRMYGFSRAEMAQKLKIGVWSLSLIERGIVPQKLNCEVLERIQNVFGILPHDMFLPMQKENLR